MVSRPARASRDGIEAYLGTTITGFLNLFLLVGPNLVLERSSMIFMMESQFAYVLDAMRTLGGRRLKWSTFVGASRRATTSGCKRLKSATRAGSRGRNVQKTARLTFLS